MSSMVVQPTAVDTDDGTLLRLATRLAGRLRRFGVGVSVGQLIDAVRALEVIDLADPAQLRTALRATLVTRVEHLPLFDAAFEAVFLPPPPVPAGGPAVPSDLEGALLDALRRGDEAALQSLVGLAVDLFAGLDGQDPARARYHIRRTLRQLDLSRMLARAIEQAGGEGDEPAVVALQARLAALEQSVASEVGRRLGAADDGEVPVAAAELSDIEFLRASPAELVRLQQAVRPLARLLAARLARRRQSQAGSRIDMRRTIRRSLCTGGVPVDLCYQRPRSRRPELVVLADLSGSVAEFARFFLLLMHALHDELPRVRSFCFVDEVDEVTGLLESLPSGLEVRHLLRTTRIVGDSGHSDYGAVLRRFDERYGEALGPRTTLLITGDGRTNGRDPRPDLLEGMARTVRRVYWLNPERRGQWDTRDSVISGYAGACTQVVEARNVGQLTDFVASLA
jgi:uncharacterized protein with von Willebrand factor type A (vWA) domain